MIKYFVKFLSIIFLILIFTPMMTQADIDLKPYIVFHYDFEETSGTNVVDKTGKYNATASNERVFTENISESGIIGSGSNFIGGNDYISVPSEAIITGNTSQSLSFWYYRDTPSIWDTTGLFQIGKTTSGTGNYLGYYMENYRNSQLVFGKSTSRQLLQNLHNSPYLVFEREWVWIYIEIPEYFNDTSEVKVYINNHFKPYNTITEVGGLNILDEVFYIGRYLSVYGNSFIDEFTYFNRTLNENERNFIFNNGSGISYTELASEFFTGETSISLETPINEDFVYVNASFLYNFANGEDINYLIYSNGDVLFNQTYNDNTRNDDITIYPNLSVGNYTIQSFLINEEENYTAQSTELMMQVTSSPSAQINIKEQTKNTVTITIININKGNLPAFTGLEHRSTFQDDYTIINNTDEEQIYITGDLLLVRGYIENYDGKYYTEEILIEKTTPSFYSDIGFETVLYFSLLSLSLIFTSLKSNDLPYKLINILGLLINLYLIFNIPAVFGNISIIIFLTPLIFLYGLLRE